MQCVEDIQKLMDVVQQTQKQMAESLAILKSRDQQIDAALTALEDIASWHTAKDHERFGCDEPCYCAGEVAREAIKKMRKIHTESLHLISISG